MQYPIFYDRFYYKFRGNKCPVCKVLIVARSSVNPLFLRRYQPQQVLIRRQAVDERPIDLIADEANANANYFNENDAPNNDLNGLEGSRQIGYTLPNIVAEETCVADTRNEGTVVDSNPKEDKENLTDDIGRASCVATDSVPRTKIALKNVNCADGCKRETKSAKYCN